MKVKKITISNLKAIESLTADFNGCTAIITGGNNKGKSTFLKSLPDRIRGVKPDIVVRKGETEGNCTWELTDGSKFIWEFDTKTKQGEKLCFITRDNIKTSVTKEIANRYFPPVFDIDEFLHAAPKKQKEILQGLVGIDFSEIDAQYKSAFDDRTFANRALKEAEARKLPYDSSLPDREKDIASLQEELLGIDAHNDRYQYVSKGISDKQKQIQKLESELKKLRKEVADGEKWLSNPSNQEKTNADALKAEIDATKANNAKIQENARAKETVSAFEKAQREAIDADKRVKDIEAKRGALIQSAKLPDGFDFSDEGITYHGYPLSKEQLSSSKIYIAALQLAAVQIGEVKTLHFDASFLDKNSLSDIEEWAEANDLQLLIERPDFDGGEIQYQLLSEVAP